MCQHLPLQAHCRSDMLVTSCARFSTRGGVVNTYDPADRILYVHMAREPDSYSDSADAGGRAGDVHSGSAPAARHVVADVYPAAEAQQQ
jgi:hypothetical protein